MRILFICCEYFSYCEKYYIVINIFFYDIVNILNILNYNIYMFKIYFNINKKLLIFY